MPWLWLSHHRLYAAQCVLKTVPSPDPRFDEVGPKLVSELLPANSSVIVLRGMARGSLGKVLAHNPNGTVKVRIVVVNAMKLLRCHRTSLTLCACLRTAVPPCAPQGASIRRNHRVLHRRPLLPRQRRSSCPAHHAAAAGYDHRHCEVLPGLLRPGPQPEGLPPAVPSGLRAIDGTGRSCPSMEVRVLLHSALSRAASRCATVCCDLACVCVCSVWATLWRRSPTCRAAGSTAKQR